MYPDKGIIYPLCTIRAKLTLKVSKRKLRKTKYSKMTKKIIFQFLYGLASQLI